MAQLIHMRQTVVVDVFWRVNILCLVYLAENVEDWFGLS